MLFLVMTFHLQQVFHCLVVYHACVWSDVPNCRLSKTKRPTITYYTIPLQEITYKQPLHIKLLDDKGKLGAPLLPSLLPGPVTETACMEFLPALIVVEMWTIHTHTGTVDLVWTYIN